MNDAAQSTASESALWRRARRERIARENECFDRMPAELLRIYKGQFIALSEGKVVDSDKDELTLASRVGTAKHRFVLIRKVPEANAS